MNPLLHLFPEMLHSGFREHRLVFEQNDQPEKPRQVEARPENEDEAETQEVQTEEDVGPRAESTLEKTQGALKTQGERLEQRSDLMGGGVENREKEVAKQIVADAAEKLSGDAKTLCQESTQEMSEAARENLGMLFLKWAKSIVPAWVRYHTEELKGAPPKDASGQDVENKEEKMPEYASASMAGTVNMFINDMNGLPRATYKHEQVWEEMRHNAQLNFEKSVGAQELGVKDEWFNKMRENYMKNEDRFKRLGVQGRSPEQEAGAKQMDEKFNGDGTNVRLDTLLQQWKKKNLLDETGRVSDHENRRGSVEIQDEEENKIEQSEGIPEKDIRLSVTPVEGETAESLQKLLETGVPSLEFEGQRDGKLLIKAESVDAARKALALLYKSEKDKVQETAA